MKKKKIIIISIITLFLILVGSTYYLYSNDNKTKLKKIGYNSLEINELLNLKEDEINKILNYDYNENLIYIIKSENYDSDKLDLYLKYINVNKDIDYLKIFNLLNSPEIKINKLDKYVSLLKKYNNIDEIINYVNNYENANIELSNITLSFMNEKYFIVDYLDRYLNYYENNTNLSLKEIISKVNSNVDYKFYENSKPTDISKGMYTIVNKYYYLDSDFVPTDLEKVSYGYTINNTELNKIALENFIKMADQAKLENLNLKITTAYRNYNFQSVLYNNYVKNDGKEKADTYSARPGYSEHQLGYSVDLTNINKSNFDEFEYTNEFKWLQDNAHKYGFILRFPKGKEHITGYQYESWHYRYVGIDIATYIHENNITYEEYYAYFLR